MLSAELKLKTAASFATQLGKRQGDTVWTRTDSSNKRLRQERLRRRAEAVRGAAWAKGVASHPQLASRPHRSQAADTQHVDKPGLETWSSVQVSAQSNL